MPHQIEILSIGGDFDAHISEAAQMLNGVQNEFHFHLPPDRLRGEGRPFANTVYTTDESFEFLKSYQTKAKGDRRFVIGVIDKQLKSSNTNREWLFGSHDHKGHAAITLLDHEAFTESTKLYLCYYFIRYALSFVCADLKNHDDTRSCFFDRKDYKPDLAKSIDSGAFCPECTKVLWKVFNEEINVGIQRMIAAMKALRADSQADIPAASLHGQIDVGIITIREDEFKSMLSRFSAHRHVRGSGSNYQYSTVNSQGGEEIRVATARSPEQGQGAAQALASSMITDLAPRWIFVVGIAGGFPASEFTLGDVLLSQRLHDFAVSAAIEGKPPEFQDMGGPMTLEVEKLVKDLPAMRNRFGDWNSNANIGKSKPIVIAPAGISDKALYGNDGWKGKVLKSLQANFPVNQGARNPDYFAAVIIDGNTLLKDPTLASQWRQSARHASGVEMELGGVCRAARYGGNGKTRVLAIRGISDIIGYDRSLEWTDFACRSAAAFADALLHSGLIQRGV